MWSYNASVYAASGKTMYVGAGSTVCFRKKASNKGAIISYLKKGTKVKALASKKSGGVNWYKVSYKGKTGYINKLYLTNTDTRKKLKNLSIPKKTEFFEVAARCKNYLYSNDFRYDSSFLKKIPLDTGTQRVVDCSSFVSWALYEFGYKEFKWTQKTSYDFMNIAKSLKSKGKKSPYYKKFRLVKKYKDLEYGDILIYNGHVQICGYPQLNKVFNAGSDEAIMTKGMTKGDSKEKHRVKDFVYALHVTKTYAQIV